MEIVGDNERSDVNHLGLFSTALYVVLGIVSWLDGILTFTEEDRLKAGISMGSEEHYV